MHAIKDAVYNKLREYTSKPIADDKKLVKDLSIYGDDFEELIEELSKQLRFDIDAFYDLFDKNGYYYPSEFYLNLPKIFYIDLGELLKGKIVYRTHEEKGRDITVGELIQLIENLIK